MATFRKRGSKWQVQVRCDGRALSRSFSTKADAEAWAKLTEVSIQRASAGLEAIPGAEAVAPSVGREAQGVTLLALLERYERTITPTKRGHVSELSRLKTLKAHRIASLPIDKVTPAEVAAYRDDRLTKVQGPSVRRELTILRHCLQVAAHEWGFDLLERNPVARLTKPSSGKARERRLSEEDLCKLTEGLKATRNPFIRHAITFATATGMRRGELLSLTWANVDLASRVAFLPLTKNGEPRAVPLSGIAVQVLMELSRVPGSGDKKDASVFPLTANALRLAWERLRRRSGIRDLRFHDLRHEAISRFFELGLSVPEVALISGHKDARTLFRYTHLKAEKVAEKLETLAKG